MSSSSSSTSESTTPEATPSEETRSSVTTGLRLQAWQVAAGVLLLAVGGLILYGFWPRITGETAADDRPETEDVASSAAQVDVVEVERMDFPVRTEATGRLRPWREATVSAERGGVVRERAIEEGQRIGEGALLVRVDDRDERIELAEAEADLIQARAEYAVNTREAGVRQVADTSAVADLREALREAEAAFDRGDASRAEVQALRRELELAQMRAGLDRSAVQAATYGLTQAEQRVERARLQLERTRITAPFAGRVADLEAEAGQRVAAGEMIARILDDRRMKVTVNVLEEDLVRINEGATAQVHVPALNGNNGRVEGTVYSVNPRVDEERGTGRVTVRIPNPEGQLLAGLFATIRLETHRLSDRIVVPTDAVLVRQGRDLVFVVRNERAQWTYVEVGARSGDFVEIVDGLQEGDRVAIDGHFALAHDAPVEASDPVPLAMP
ncbi:MAG: efflux RND transporter periplasmic adaptor subunit [Longimonas sp.]|uniref:efflux RND transporter periplasmic adaptor subunit n=1 Tax=Longimonas sp. TaxID=2039626 RepID=UPI003349C693